MVSSCSACNCGNRKVKGDGLKRHRFPISNDELCKRWLAAIDESVEYLSELKDLNGFTILKTKRKTFVQGHITLAFIVLTLRLQFIGCIPSICIHTSLLKGEEGDRVGRCPGYGDFLVRYPVNFR
jgi:hypothetical protein